MKKIINMLTIFLLLAPIAIAFDRPPVLDITGLEINQPISPGTGDVGECVPWEIKDESCIGNVRHWTLCQKTVSGGVYQLHSEICTDYGENVKCINGKCVKSEDMTKTIFYSLGVIVLILFIIFIIMRWRKK